MAQRPTVTLTHHDPCRGTLLCKHTGSLVSLSCSAVVLIFQLACSQVLSRMMRHSRLDLCWQTAAAPSLCNTGSGFASNPHQAKTVTGWKTSASHLCQTWNDILVIFLSKSRDGTQHKQSNPYIKLKKKKKFKAIWGNMLIWKRVVGLEDLLVKCFVCLGHFIKICCFLTVLEQRQEELKQPELVP